jgi:hypothetical protein
MRLRALIPSKTHINSIRRAIISMIETLSVFCKQRRKALELYRQVPGLRIAAAVSISSIGSSTGAIILTHIARDIPQLVHRMLLISPAIHLADWFEKQGEA